MLRLLTILAVAIVGLSLSPGVSPKAVAYAQDTCWCCTCQGSGCNCHTCLPGGTTCDNRGGSGCDVTGTCPQSFGALNLLGDGSVLTASLDLAPSDVTSQAPSAGIRVAERLSLREGWLVARDCRGIIVHRKVAAEEVARTREQLSEIVLE